MQLIELIPGGKAIISGYSTEDVPPKILELGLIPGTCVCMKNSAPFNGPICISITENDSNLALRKTIAACILVEPVIESEKILSNG